MREGEDGRGCVCVHISKKAHTHTYTETRPKTTCLEAVVAVDARDGVEVDGPQRALVELVLDRRLRRQALRLLHNMMGWMRRFGCVCV